MVCNRVALAAMLTTDARRQLRLAGGVKKAISAFAGPTPRRRRRGGERVRIGTNRRSSPSRLRRPRWWICRCRCSLLRNVVEVNRLAGRELPVGWRFHDNGQSDQRTAAIEKNRRILPATGKDLACRLCWTYCHPAFQRPSVAEVTQKTAMNMAFRRFIAIEVIS